MIIRNSKAGGFTCFLSIIMTGVIVVFTILSQASSIRCEEALLTGILLQHQDLVLSEYSEKLLDWYGVYATAIPDSKETDFNTATAGISHLSSYSCEGMEPLESDHHLKDAILAFSRPRLPLQLSLQVLGRFTRMNRLIESCQTSILQDEIPEEPETDVPKPRIPVNEKEAPPENYEDVIRLLGLIEPETLNTTGHDSGQNNDQYTGKVPARVSFDELNEMLKNSGSDPVYEMDVSKQIKSSLTVTESHMNEVSSLLDQFYQIGSNSFYDFLCLEFYAPAMFSCKTNARIQDGAEVERMDMRNRSISSLPVRSKMEIEKIIFGSPKEETNDFLTKIAIESVRFLIHLISNATDKTKKAEITAVAILLCSAVAAATGGAVAVPEKMMEVVVLILYSMNSAAEDYSTLSEGRSVALLPMQSSEKFDTFYTDYLQLFLFTIPEQVKISRMTSIMRDNLAMEHTKLYTGVAVSVKYRDSTYQVNGCYNEEETNKTGE